MKSHEIIERLQLSDARGLEIVFKLYHRPLLYFTFQIVKNESVAEEIVSDAFVKLWNCRSEFDEVNKLRSFLYVVVKNASFNYLRTSEYKTEKVGVSDYTELLSKDPAILERIVRAELIDHIYLEVEKLPEKQRKVFLLTFKEDLTPEEISEELQLNLSAVYANKSRAIATLRRNLTPEDLTYLSVFFTFWL